MVFIREFNKEGFVSYLATECEFSFSCLIILHVEKCFASGPFFHGSPVLKLVTLSLSVILQQSQQNVAFCSAVAQEH